MKLFSRTFPAPYLFYLFLIGTWFGQSRPASAISPSNLRITDFRVTPSVVRVGQPFTIRFRVANFGPEEALTQGPSPGTTYEQGESWRSKGYRIEPGRARLGVSISGPRGRSYPYQWGLGSPLPPTQSRIVTGKIVMRQPGNYAFYAAPFVGDRQGRRATKIVHGVRVVSAGREIRNRSIRAVVEPTRISVNGTIIDSPEPPLVLRGVVYVPIRFPSEALDSQVMWDQQLKRVDIRKGDRHVRLEIGNLNAWVNDELVTLYHRPFIQDERTYVPLRFVSESLGANVEWDGPTRTIQIRT